MANELKIIANDPGLFLVAKLTQDGQQQGGDIALTESAFIPGFYLGSVPPGTPAGIYALLAYDGSTLVSSGVLYWLGERELDPRALDDLHLIHGLRQGAPLNVTPTQRDAGSITQSITQSGDRVTLSRG